MSDDMTRRGASGFGVVQVAVALALLAAGLAVLPFARDSYLVQQIWTAICAFAA